MILISSMGGCASTSLISWVGRRTKCNCPLNSEGLRVKGPGSNSTGLKHRQTPPANGDKYLLAENSYNRTDINFGRIDRALFLYDFPYNMVLSLFHRKIAMGHAMAVTGQKPNHRNSLDEFLDRGIDSFGFDKQFASWTDSEFTCDYPRMVVHFSALWEHTDIILDFLGIDRSNLTAFPLKHERSDRFGELEDKLKEQLIFIYGELDERMKKYPTVVTI